MTELFILTEAQRISLMALNDASECLDPIPIDNPAANTVGASLGLGNLVGLYFLPSRLATDPACSRWHDQLSGLTAYSIDPAQLVTPLTAI